jgi:hypothetical protein
MALSATEIQDQNRSEVPTQSVTNTGWGNIITKCVVTRQPFNLPQYTTLNERYNILATQSIGPKNGKDFELKYFGVGIRGSDCDGKNLLGATKMKVNQHQPKDANLFVPIPFACRPVASDFDNVNRGKYRMRTVQDVNGVATAFYWLKLISFANYNPQVMVITRDENNNETPVPYIPEKDDLFNPTPVDFISTGSVPISNVYMNSSAILDCSLDQADLTEMENACRILYGDASLAAPNEVGIAYGIDTQTDGQIGQGAVIRYTEVLSAVYAHYITERDARSALNNVRLQYAFDHGASEPMLLHTNATVAP